MSKEDKNYKCSLCPQTLKKAKEEMNEHPETRLMEVKELRKRVCKIPGLIPRTDTKFMLAFLRGHCFDQEKTFKLYHDFYQMKIDRKDIFEDLKPSRVRHVIECNVVDVLKHRDNEGRRIIAYRAHKWDPDRCPMADTLKLFAIICQRLMEEEETLVNGMRAIYDMGHLTLKQITAIGPMQAKTLIHLAFHCFPLHIRRADFFNQNSFFDVFFAIFSPFLDADLMKRIHFNGKNTASLLESMHPDHIPSDFGGNEEPFSNQEWWDDLLEMDKWYEDNNKFGFVSMKLENEKKESTKENAGMQGLGGSFKKLAV